MTDLFQKEPGNSVLAQMSFFCPRSIWPAALGHMFVVELEKTSRRAVRILCNRPGSCLMLEALSEMFGLFNKLYFVFREMPTWSLKGCFNQLF